MAQAKKLLEVENLKTYFYTQPVDITSLDPHGNEIRSIRGHYLSLYCPWLKCCGTYQWPGDGYVSREDSGDGQ